MSSLPLFDRLLPAPKFLSMPSVGIDISDTSLKYMGFTPDRNNADQFHLDVWGEITIPDGVLQFGDVLDVEALAEVLRKLKKKIKTNFVRLSLPEEKAYIFETEIKATTPAAEIRGLLEFRLEENVPIAAKDAIFDYQILPSTNDSRSLRVVVTAYAREVIEKYYQATEKVGLIPVSFELEAAAMVRSVLPNKSEGAQLLVDFGRNRTGIGIVYNGALVYTSTIDYGGYQLSQVLRKVLGDKTEEELTAVKNSQGIISGVKDTAVAEALLSTVSVIRDEISRRIQYWHGQDYKKADRRITSIILAGGSANLRGLPEYFTETLFIPTKRANVWQNAFSYDDFVPPIDLQHSYSYATVIGLALKPHIEL